MKALSFIQPYAWLSAAGIKPVDNRPRYTSYRGRFYIHASKKYNPNIAGLSEHWILERMVEEERNRYYSEPKTLGAIIGEATLDDCVKDSTSPWFVGKFGLLLSNSLLYDKPIPCKGMLGFFEPQINTNLSGEQGE